MSKQKGKRGEVEASALLGSILTSVASGGKRNGRVWADVHAQGGDIISIEGLSIEVKRQEVLTISTWWRQAVRQAEADGSIPVLMYRQNRRTWRFCIPAYLLVIGLEGYIELDESVFGQWLVHYTGG